MIFRATGIEPSPRGRRVAIQQRLSFPDLRDAVVKARAKAVVISPAAWGELMNDRWFKDAFWRCRQLGHVRVEGAFLRVSDAIEGVHLFTDLGDALDVKGKAP